MRKIKGSIPVNHFGDEGDFGISIEKMFVERLPFSEEAEQSHRHDRHSFFLLEKGAVSIEIDFQKHTIEPYSILYMHPDQVHRMLEFENVTVSSWAISNDNLNPEYLKLLEEITPAKPLILSTETYAVFSEAVSLCVKFTERKNSKLYHSILRDSCNALAALAISQFLEQSKSSDNFSRFEIVTKAFRETLERDFNRTKRPAAYAQTLNISTPYLNECVKSITGISVSQHIQQRVILEAKRLLYYSDKSVKEIATALGYDDYPYFSRLFSKVTGMSALAFRNKNLD